MSELIAIVYSDEARAEEVRKKLFELQKEYLIEIGDAVIATKDANGQVKLNQLFNTTAAGAVSGSFWGLLVGLIFLNPLLGTAVGAASGALGGAMSDFGIDDKFMKDVAGAIQPGNACLFILARRITTDKVVDAIKGFGGTVLRTSLDRSKEAALREALAGTLPAAASQAAPGPTSTTSVPQT